MDLADGIGGQRILLTARRSTVSTPPTQTASERPSNNKLGHVTFRPDMTMRQNRQW
jgi:hypothetical protein